MTIVSQDRDVPVALFEEEVAKVTRTIGRDHGVHVVFQGNEARTEGNTVYFPVLDQNASLSPERVRIGRGYVDHEAAHIRHSHMPLLEGMNKTAMQKGDHLFANVMNALEDVRLESIMIADYPGAQKNLEATADAVYKHFLTQKHPSTIYSDHKMMSGLALTIAGRKMMGYSSDAMEDIWKQLDPALQTKVKNWIKLIGSCRPGQDGTEDVVNITKKIVHDLRYDPQEDEEEEGGSCGAQQPGSGSGGGGSSPGDGQGKAAAADTYESGHVEITGTTAFSGGGGIGAGGEMDAVIVPDDFKFEDDGTRPPSGGLQFTSVFGDLINTNKKGAYRPFTKNCDKLHTAYDDPGKYVYDTGNYTHGVKLRHEVGRRLYQETLTNATGKVSVIRRKLYRMLMSKLHRDWDILKEEGRLDTKRFVSAFNGQSNVFKTRSDAPELDTAVMMLIDLSGSMHGDKVFLAQQAATMLVEALASMVATSIMGFACGSGFDKATNDAIRSARSAGQEFSRTQPIDMFMFKSFNESLRLAKTAIGNIANMSMGSNCDGESVMAAFQQLAPRPEKRKVLMVLSDGFPAFGCDYGQEHIDKHLATTVKMIQHKNVEVIGIGIMSDAVKQFYPKWVVLNRIEDLSGVVLDQIGRVMLGDRTVLDNSMLMKV